MEERKIKNLFLTRNIDKDAGVRWTSPSQRAIDKINELYILASFYDKNNSEKPETNDIVYLYDGGNTKKETKERGLYGKGEVYKIINIPGQTACVLKLTHPKSNLVGYDNKLNAIEKNFYVRIL